MAADSPSPIPHIHLLCRDEPFSSAFTTAAEKHALPASVSYTIHSSSLADLPGSVRLDAVVSPANSYGRLDGAFDDAISRALSPRHDYLALTRAAQAVLYARWRGFAPPGTCTLVPVPRAFDALSRNAWGARYVALCPTMRVPCDARWDREVVYECVWSLMCELDRHNQAVRRGGGGGGGGGGEEGDGDGEAGRIDSFLMTPLATGIGGLSAQRWAEQAVLALKHYVDAIEDPAKWSELDPWTISDYAAEVEKTWEL